MNQFFVAPMIGSLYGWIKNERSNTLNCLSKNEEFTAKGNHNPIVDYSQQTAVMGVRKLFGMLGNELRKARERSELTQEQLALDANVDRTYISMLENNKKSPTVDMLFRICDAMDIAASDIIRRVERGDSDEPRG